MLEIHDIRLSYGRLQVLRGINLTVSEGEIVCLLGPSGCGKTSLLRVITGLERPAAGDVRFKGDSLLHVPVHARGFGLMFQDFALFPHLNVEENVAFGLRMQGMPPRQRMVRALEVLRLVNLEGYWNRDVAQLSGGEKQRVALARSLAPNPRLLLLDEPLGSLDAALRERLIVELRSIIRRAGLTAIYVTHDQLEAFAIADRIVIMNAGQVDQVGSPHALYHRPQTIFAAQFLGLTNIVPIIERDATQRTRITTPLGDFQVDEDAEALLIHPNSLTPNGFSNISHNGAGADMQQVTGTVSQCVYRGDSYQIHVDHDSGLTLTFRTSIPLKLDETVTLAFHRDAVLPLSNRLP